jgi:hypothetical protein
MAFCFSSSSAVRVRRTFYILVWCRLELGSSRSQNILDGSTDAIVYGWSRRRLAALLFMSVFNAFLSSI